MNRLRRHDPAVAERISAYRNVLVHGYDAIDYPTVWLAVQESLPVLKAEVEQLLREAEGDSPAGA